jgi:hypothetical protein
VENKRKLKRRALVYNLKIYDAETDSLVGRVIDVSAEGLKITGTAGIVADTRSELVMELPEPISGKKKIRFSAQAKWCRPDINPRFTATGMEFLTLSPENQQIIISLMARYALPA